VTSTPAYPARLLWFETLDFPLTWRDAADLAEQTGIVVLGLDDPDEWVIGYRVIGPPSLDAATILNLTRRLRLPGVRFDMTTTSSAPPPTEDVHELVKQYIREYTPVLKLHQETDSAELPRWQSARSVTVDYRAQLTDLRKQNLALARAHLAERLNFEAPALAAAGLSGYAQVDLAFPPAGTDLDITVGVGVEGSFSRVRLRAAIGERTVTARFNSAGIATIKGLALDPGTDLLHLAFEIRS